LGWLPTVLILSWFEFGFEFLVSGMLLLVPLVADGLTQMFFQRQSTNPLRFATGFMAGVGISMVAKFAGVLLHSLF
jgi:uncharacterized membrane protein